MAEYSVFTSESVSEGHPDKVADQISDAVLDAMLSQDRESRVACETLIKTGIIVVAGEVRTRARVNIEELVKQVVRNIGYTDAASGFDTDNATVINALGMQSQVMQDILRSNRLTSNARFGKREVFSNRRVKVMTHHEHV